MTACEVRLAGCDETTVFTVELTDKELDVAERIAGLSRVASSYSCEPRMYVKKLQEVTAP